MKDDDLMYNDMDPADGFYAGDMDEDDQNEYETNDTENELDAFEDEDM